MSAADPGLTIKKSQAAVASSNVTTLGPSASLDGGGKAVSDEAAAVKDGGSSDKAMVGAKALGVVVKQGVPDGGQQQWSASSDSDYDTGGVYGSMACLLHPERFRRVSSPSSGGNGIKAASISDSEVPLTLDGGENLPFPTGFLAALRSQ
eukprot:g36308.t1